mgnify:CR=1 FL=1
MNEEFAGMIGGVSAMVAIAWVVRAALDHQRAKRIIGAQAELQHKLLEKFGSSKELMEFLGSGAGQRFLLSTAPAPGNPYARILGSIRSGILLTLLGGAMLFLSDRIAEAAEGFSMLGAIALVLGIGFLLSSAVVYLLSRSWGLLPRGPEAAGGLGNV